MVPADSRRIPRVPRYSGAVSPGPVVSLTGLSPSAALLSRRFCYQWPVAFSTVLQPRLPPRRRRFGLLRFRSPLLAQSLLFSLPPGTKMFQFPGFAPRHCVVMESLPSGCPIRTSALHWVFAPGRGFSQLVTSFFASESLGILHVPFPPFFFPLKEAGPLPVLFLSLFYFLPPGTQAGR